MDTLHDLLRFMHIMGFVFMSVPLFNLIVVNERASLGKPFDYDTDRYMENIIKNGAFRCFVFQSTVLATGVLLLYFALVASLNALVEVCLHLLDPRVETE